MKNNKLPIILIIASLALLIVNFVDTSDAKDEGFWLRISSSVLLIIAMVFTIKKNNERQ